MKYFLFVYDNHALEQLVREEFTLEQRPAAVRRRRELQQEYRARPDVEILLFGADRFEDLLKTHGRFFPAEAKTIEETVAAAASTALPSN